ncbi:hypothetical protein MMC13_006354 [Lambiella insularis]|nr:hypothetical protein [Lambiella insularis]
MSTSDLFLALIAVLFPPIAVWIKRGLCSLDSLLNLLLCFLGFLPGLLHAWYIIAKYPDAADYEAVNQDPEGGRVTYYYVSSDGQRMDGGNASAQRKPAPRQPQQGYGATQQQGSGSAGPQEGSSQGGVPPSYDDAVKGDNKVQT